MTRRAWFILLLLLTFTASGAEARRARRGKKKPKPAPAASAAPTAEPEASEASQPAGTAEAVEPSEPGAKGDPKKAKGPKVMDFSGLSVEGKLRTPQLLYFLGRVKEELGRASLENRSFMPELVRSVDEGDL